MRYEIESNGETIGMFNCFESGSISAVALSNAKPNVPFTLKGMFFNYTYINGVEQ